MVVGAVVEVFCLRYSTVFSTCMDNEKRAAVVISNGRLKFDEHTYLAEPEPVRLEDQPRDKGHLLDRVEEVQVKVADGVEGRPVEAQSRKEKKWMKKMDGLIN